MANKSTIFYLESAIPKMKKYLSTQRDVVAAYIFGSYAVGKETKRSDLDIGVIFSKRPLSYNRQFQIAKDLEELINGPEVDVRELSPESSPVFLMSALKNARLIVENNPRQRINFEVKTMQEYTDNEKYRSIQYYYLNKRIKEGKYAT